MDGSPSWWAGARLCLGGQATGGQPEELGFGTLAEIVSLATSRPRSERPHLFIRMELTGVEWGWAEIALLAARPDRPVII